MKKLLFILILTTIFIPLSQTGASLGEANESNIEKVNKIQLTDMQASNEIDAVKCEKLLQAKMKKREAKINKISLNKAKLTKKRISSEKRDRLFGLLLLSHGGQR